MFCENPVYKSYVNGIQSPDLETFTRIKILILGAGAKTPYFPGETDMIDQKELHNKIYAGENVIGHRKMKYVTEKFFLDMVRLADVKPWESVLDLGSGHGKFSNIYPKNIIATDIAKEASNFTKAQFVVADALFLPLKSETFDKIFCSEVIEHFPTQGSIKDSLSEMWRVLKPGGHAIISTPNENSLIGMLRYLVKGYKEPPGSIHTSLVSIHGLKELLKRQGFEIEKVYTYLLPLPYPKYDYNLSYDAMKILYHLGRIFPKLSHGIIIKVKKPKK